MDYEEAVKPFDIGSSKNIVLLLHGYTGSPYEIRDLANYLVKRGFRVVAPLLPGHGEDKEALRQTTWKDWWSHIKFTLNAIFSQDPENVFVSGLSMGGAFTLYAAAQYPQIKAIAPICAPVFIKSKLLLLLPILSRIFTYIPLLGNEIDIQDPKARNDPFFAEQLKRYNKILLPTVVSLLDLLKKIKTEELQHIAQPILICQAKKDRVVHPSNATYIFEHVISLEKKILWLEHSGHVATMDLDKEVLFTAIGDFFTRFS